MRCQASHRTRLASLSFVCLLSFGVLAACSDDGGSTEGAADATAGTGSEDEVGDSSSEGESSSSGSDTGTGTGETSSEDTSTDDASTDDTSTDDASTEDSSTEDSSTEDTGTEDTSTEDTGTEDTGETDTGSTIDLPEWLLSIDNMGTVHRLVRISIVDGEQGATDVICDDLAIPDGIPQNTSFNSLTFNDLTLLASMRDVLPGDTLALVDPCACEVSVIGKYGFERVNGITSNEEQVMFGTSNEQDAMIQIDPMTAMSMQIQDLGDWGSGGLTWSQPEDNVLYAINSQDDQLYTFDGDDAALLGMLPLSEPFGSVGMELHPTLGTIYACGVNSNPTGLHTVDPATGTVTFLGDMDLGSNCSNLAAPFGPVECIPQ